ncbi:hypothetical protein ACFQ0B_79690 [Nonomuraea thailandensis]
MAEARGTGEAVAAARAQKSPVVVADLTTEDRLVRAQPDGTLTAELSPGIVRVRRDQGWAAVDTTLELRADGRIAPRAAAVDLALSGGGSDAPLVRYGRAGKWLELSWPGTLPEPALSGNTATYAEVFPGVDLVMRAGADGYAQYLVIKTAEAAKRPEVASVRLGLRAGGLKVRGKAKGALKAVDDRGEVVFEAPPSLMWDSGEQAKQAVAAVAVDEESLTWKPDQKLLADPATRFPVTVDPVWTSPARTGWAKVLSGYPNDEYWDGGIDGGEAKVGKCYPDPHCAGIGVARSYFQYNTAILNGKTILQATLNTTVTYGPACGTWREHQVYLASSPISRSTNWINKPGGNLVDTKGVDTAYGGCPEHKPVGFNVIGGIRTNDVSTYYLQATDENDGFAWRKYDPVATVLVVRYNTAPNAAYELTTDPPLPAPCRWCGGIPYIGDASIRLKGRLSDPDNDQIRPLWAIYPDGSQDLRDQGPTGNSGSVFSTDLNLTGHHGKKVGWLLRAHDGAAAGPQTEGPGFVVDQVGIGVKPKVTGVLYRDDNRWHGGVGVPGSFTFEPAQEVAAGQGDIDHYVYGWQDPPTTRVDADALGGKATVSTAPLRDGPNDLYVQSVDRGGTTARRRGTTSMSARGTAPTASGRWRAARRTRRSWARVTERWPGRCRMPRARWVTGLPSRPPPHPA